MLSEDAKSRSLTERITDAARNERSGLLIISLGFFLVSAGLIISAVGNTVFAYVGGIIAMVLGVLSTMFGFYVSVYSAREYNKLLRELDSAGTV